MNRIARMSLGLILLAIGLVSVFVPFLPGALFIIAGLVLMGNHQARYVLHALRHKIAVVVGKRWAQVFLPPHMEAACCQKNSR